MDPSYNNGVGAQQTPQNSPEQQPKNQPVSFGAGVDASNGTGTGAVFGTGSSLGTNSNFGGMQNNAPVSSGAGDIILGGSEPKKKSRRGIIVLIILALLLVLIGGGILLWQSGLLGGKADQPRSVSLKERYNNYVNYVLFGEESMADVDITKIREIEPYYLNLKEDAIETYVANAKNKYKELSELYDIQEIDNKMNLSELDAFFCDYVMVKPLNQASILEMYLNDGEEEAKTIISSYYDSSNYTNEDFIAYLTAIKNQSDLILDLTVKTDTSGCVKNGKIIENCYKMNENESKKLTDVSIKVSDTILNLNFNSLDMLDNLYNQIYDTVEKSDE